MRPWQEEALVYFGRHDKRYPADGAQGYPACYHGQVSRAIPVMGTVTSGASWERSPQVRAWLDPEPKTLWERFIDWLNK